MTDRGRVAMVGAGLLLVAAAAGCSGGSATEVAGPTRSSAASPAGEVATASPTLEEYFAPISTAMREAGSFRATMLMDGSGLQFETTMLVKLGVDGLASMHMRMNQPASAITQNPADTNDVSIEVIVIDRDLYILMPAEAGLNAPTNWLSSTLDATDPVSQQLAASVALMSDEFNYGALQAEYMPYTTVGASRSEVVNGVDGTVTELELALADMLEDLKLPAAGAPEEVLYTVVTDELSRLASVESDIGGMGQIVVHYSDYGTTAEITPPPSGQVSPLADVLVTGG